VVLSQRQERVEMSSVGGRDSSELARTISREMVRIHNDSYGQTAGPARTYILDDVILSVIDIELLPSEKVLVQAGRAELVQEVRHGFQQALESAFKAAVERATGRSVIAFVSETHIDPDFAVELFRLDGGLPSRS
jgi:uncharacterized protein YbcI